MNAKVAPSAATAMSQAATRPMPPARAWPLTCATTGLRSVAICRSSPISSSGPLLIESALRSAPEQKVEPVWVSSTARTPSSPSASSRAAASSSTSAADRALRLCGESRVRTAMPRSVCRRTSGAVVT